MDPRKQDGVVIPCECGKVYMGEQKKVHAWTDIRLSRTQTSAVYEYANKTEHYPLWDEVKFIGRGPHWYSRRVNEAIRITLFSPNNTNNAFGRVH